MRPKVLLILALGFVVAGASGVAAQTAPDSTHAAPDTTAATSAAAPDTSAAKPDSVSTPPVAPAAAPAVGATAPATQTAPPTTQTPAPATQAPPPASTPPPAATAAKAESKPNDRIYYGGTVSFSFGSTWAIGFYPMLGYKLTPKISGGAEVGYEYVDYGDQSTHNYGASIFGRFHAKRNAYAMVEYQTTNYEIFGPFGQSKREWVPFMLVGGGVVKPINARMSVYAEVLFDVLQDERSPYDRWEPIVTVGAGVGF